MLNTYNIENYRVLGGIPDDITPRGEIVEIRITYTKTIEIPFNADFDKTLDDAFSEIELSDLDYDYEIIDTF